jgi:hypothetical protein
VATWNLQTLTALCVHELTFLDPEEMMEGEGVIPTSKPLRAFVVKRFLR